MKKKVFLSKKSNNIKENQYGNVSGSGIYPEEIPIQFTNSEYPYSGIEC
jgi:hypothetical protein